MLYLEKHLVHVLALLLLCASIVQGQFGLFNASSLFSGNSSIFDGFISSSEDASEAASDSADSVSASPSKPHILLIVVDDLGFGDLGHKVKQINTPTIDSLFEMGIELTNYYVLPSCSPTRAAFMTGRYPVRYGMNRVLSTFHPEGVPLNERFLPETLKTYGYRTHMVGKWHLGYHRWEYTPNYRGFEHFVGSYTGMFGYFNYSQKFGGTWGPFQAEESHYDLHEANGEKCGPDCARVIDHSGWYSTDFYTHKAVSIIQDHDPKEPLFLYMAYQAVHEPAEAPDRYTEQYKDLIRNPQRRVFAGMLSAVDESLHRITSKLGEKDMFDDTLFIFTSDNGGPTEMCGPQGSSNWPLRGGKCTVWEGGTKSPAFIMGARIPRESVGTKYHGLMHAVDWLPTLLHVIGGAPDSQKPLDGINQWKAIIAGGDSPRTEIFYGIGNNIYNDGVAFRKGEWKLIVGNPGAGLWSTQANMTGIPLAVRPRVLAGRPNHPMGWTRMSALYRLSKDPQELHDLRERQPNVVKTLQKRLRPYLSIQANHEWDSVDQLCISPPAVVDIRRGPNGMPAAVPWCILHKNTSINELPVESHEAKETPPLEDVVDTQQTTTEAPQQENDVDTEQAQEADTEETTEAPRQENDMDTEQAPEADTQETEAPQQEDAKDNAALDGTEQANAGASQPEAAADDAEQANAGATRPEAAADDAEQAQQGDTGEFAAEPDQGNNNMDVNDAEQVQQDNTSANGDATQPEHAQDEAGQATQDGTQETEQPADQEDAKDDAEDSQQSDVQNRTQNAETVHIDPKEDYAQQEDVVQAVARAAIEQKNQQAAELSRQDEQEFANENNEQEFANEDTDQDTDQDRKYSWDVTAAPLPVETADAEEVEDTQQAASEESPRQYQEGAAEESTELDSVPRQEGCTDDDQSIIDAMSQRGYTISGCSGLKYYCSNNDVGPLIRTHCIATCTACNEEEHQYSWDVTAAPQEAAGQ